MKKLAYIILSIIIGLNCVARVVMPGLFLIVGTIIILGTGLLYVVSAVQSKTNVFHEYIGWSWMILPILFSYEFVMDSFTSWNKSTLFVCGLCISIVIISFWIKDELTETERFSFFNGLACIVIASSIGYCPMAINESIVKETFFTELNVSAKDEFVSSQSFFDRTTYYLEIKYESDSVKINGLQVSKEYYDNVNINTHIPICIYEGCLGQKFYMLFEDPEKSYDFYGLNVWTKEMYADLQKITD